MSNTDNFKNLFFNQNKITIVVALVSVLIIGMTIPPPLQSHAQSVPINLDEILKNALAGSDLDLDILNENQLCSNKIGLVGNFDSLLGEYYNNPICFIVKEVLG